MEIIERTEDEGIFDGGGGCFMPEHATNSRSADKAKGLSPCLLGF
jgi:hypothetical protein